MKMFSPVFAGEMRETDSSTSPPKPIALLSEDEKALIDKMQVRDDGALTLNGLPVDRASGAVGAVVVDALPSTGLFPGMKCTVTGQGTYFYDARRTRWVQVEAFENAYDIALSVYDGYTEGEVVCSVPIPRAAKLPELLVGSVATCADVDAVAQFELYLETDLIATIDFSNSGTGVLTGLSDIVFIKAGEELSLKSVSGSLTNVSVVLKAELLSA